MSADNSSTRDTLPTFRYHSDPIGTGSVEASGRTCIACGEAKGYIYVGPVYSEQDIQDIEESVCPWCIADGTAHSLFAAEFTDMAGIGRGEGWDEVPVAVQEEVAYRTPGFNTWQGDAWFTHCGDAAAFLGPMGRDELETQGPAAVEAIRAESGYEGDDWRDYYEGLERDGSPTAYLFRCLSCGAYGGFSDVD
jgi:uncharacterized protein